MNSALLVLERAVELSRALDAAGFRHALGGALALAYHVRDPRGTNDINVNVSADPDDPERLFLTLPRGIVWEAADVGRAVRDGQVRLSWGEDRLRATPVDLFLPQHELHAVVAERAELVPMLDDMVPILSATDLTVFKALFDRTKDWADIEELLAYGEVDQQEVLVWLERIVGADDRRVARLHAAAAEAGRDAPTPRELFGRRS